jgi:xanthine dehydrogenase YagS FAD-binding subunit
MRPFAYRRADDPTSAIEAAGGLASPNVSATDNPLQFLAGGTTLIDLMKLDVLRPQHLIDINPMAQAGYGAIEVTDHGLKLGAMVRMAEAADHPAIRRDYPVIAEALTLGASQQLRNMASLGGNVLQRTRCTYFRDTSWPCNKREPGSGCAAMEGVNRMHAVLGTSAHCIATYPGDFPQALIALEGSVDLLGPDGARTVPFAGFHRLPGDRPDCETNLRPGELITGFTVPAGPWTRRSLYLKVRDRQSYEFALASAAVALELRDGVVHEARIALGGVATVPWRSGEAEAALKGQPLNEETASTAAEAAFAPARAHGHNAYKLPLGKRTLVRALLQASQMEI